MIFDKTVRYPYDSILDYSQFTVYISGSKILSGEVELFKELLSIREEEITRLRENGSRIKHLLQYSIDTHGKQEQMNPNLLSHLDAVDMALFEVATKYKNQ